MAAGALSGLRNQIAFAHRVAANRLGEDVGGGGDEAVSPVLGSARKSTTQTDPPDRGAGRKVGTRRVRELRSAFDCG